MENVYQLAAGLVELDGQVNVLEAEIEELNERLEEIYINNGGEVTEETEGLDAVMTERQAKIDELETLKKEVVADILNHTDDYAEMVLNKKAQKAQLEAEFNAYKKSVEAASKRYQSRIDRVQRGIEWWTDQIDLAFQLGNVEKVGGPKTDFRHTIYYQKTSSLDVHDNILDRFMEVLDECRAALPAWVNLKAEVNKTLLKKETKLPEGAVIVENKSIRVK